MIFFKKNDLILRDIIPNGYTDIHSHLLPGIDDGAQTEEDTILLLNELKAIGFENCITTPHIYHQVWDNTAAIITKTHEGISGTLKENNLQPLKVSAEYLLDEYFMELVKKKELLPLKDNYVLIEMSYLNPPRQVFEMLFEMQIAGYKPILAHPERYNFYHNHFNQYLKLKNQGCLFQLNLLSATGYYGHSVAKATDELLKKDLIDFVGSDVHHMKHVKSFNNKIILKNKDTLKAVISNNTFFTF